MGVSSYEDLLAHKGHEFECVTYGPSKNDERTEGDVNVSLECVTCYVVIIDYDKYPEPEEGTTITRPAKKQKEKR